LDLLSGGCLDRKAGALPLRVADVEPTGFKSAGAQEANGVVGVDAVRAATVRHDLAAPGQRGCNLFKGGKRSGPGTLDVASQKLVLRPHIEKQDTPACESVDELGCRELLDLLALPEIVVGENGDLGHVPRSDVPDCSPELGYPLAREGVVDPSPVPSRAGEAALREQPQMVRGSCHALARLARDRLDRPLTLGEQVDDLGPTPARERGGDGSECVEESSLGVCVGHIFKLSFEDTNVKKPRAHAEVRPRGRACLSGRRATFGTWEELERLAEELPPERRSLPILVAGTGLRPEEWLALERRDVDTKAGVLHVRRVYTDGRVREYGKQSRSIRRVPLRQRAVDALRVHPWRLDTPLVYPGDRGGYLNLHAWRRDEWYPALDGAGLPHRVPYAMRHTFASFAIAAGVSLFYLARIMGTSVEQIDRTYGHMLPESEDYLRGLLDAYDTSSSVSAATLLNG
jgi:hypothetical protein